MPPVLTDIGLGHYLTVSTLVFAFGCAVIMMRRNVIAVLMGVELIMNAAALNFVAFERFVQPNDGVNGHVIAIFIIVAAAAEAAVALALALNFFTRFDSIHIDQGSELKE